MLGARSVPPVLSKKLLLAFAVPFVPLLPYAAAVQHSPSIVLVLSSPWSGFFVPDLVLRTEAASGARRSSSTCQRRSR